MKFRKLKDKDCLDMTKPNWKSHPLIGLKIITRPYRKIILFLAIVTFVVTSFLPGPNIPGFYLVKLILGKFG